MVSARTVTPEAVVLEQLDEKIAHRYLEWTHPGVRPSGFTIVRPVPSPRRYAEHAVELMLKAVDPNAV